MSLNIARHSQSETVRSLAAYLPGGELFESAFIPGSNFNALLAGLSGELLRAENFLFLYNSEFIPDETTVFIEEWEAAVGIPDDCFIITEGQTNEVRRRNILVKLASLGVQTVDDFENLAVLMGFPDVTVLPGIDAVGSDLVINGGFDTAASWVLGTGWDITGGTANHTPGFGLNIKQEFSTTVSTIYILTFDILNRTAGSLSVRVGFGSSKTGIDQNITQAIVLLSDSIPPPAGNDGVQFTPTNDFDGSIDNVSVAELNAGIVAPRFTIFVDLNFSGNDYPLKYAYPYGTDANNIIRCLFEKLKPANCVIIFSS